MQLDQNPRTARQQVILAVVGFSSMLIAFSSGVEGIWQPLMAFGPFAVTAIILRSHERRRREAEAEGDRP